LIGHGDSTPSHLYPNDSNTEDTWPEGLAHLTQLGIEQEFKFGQYLRKHYIDQYTFLSPTYKSYELHVQSTDTSRTLMSATALLQGLYPSKEAALWDPVPVHTRPLHKDPMLNMDIPCERFNRGFLAALSTEKGKKFVSDNQEFIDFVTGEAGYANSTINSIWDVYSTLQIEIWNNKSTPSWVTPEVFEHLKLMYWKKFEFLYHSEDQQKIKGGLFLTETDDTITAVLTALGIWDRNVPLVGAAVFFEVYFTHVQTYSIRVLYKNDTRTDPFTDPYRVIMPGGVVALSVFSVVFLIGLVSLFVWCYRRQQQEVHYQPANFASEPRI
ncbi:hypothetical protein LSH36_143g03010, partial [Paralvinella palmiformis]